MQRNDVAEMKRLLKYANYQKVATELGVSRAAVSDWSRGKDVSPRRVEQVRALIKESLGRKTSPPQSFDWDGLMITVDAIAEAVDAKLPDSDEAMERAVAERKRLLRQRSAKGRKASQRLPDDGSGVGQ